MSDLPWMAGGAAMAFIYLLALSMAVMAFFVPWMVYGIFRDTKMNRQLLTAINENLMTISKQINHAVGPVVVPPGAGPRMPARPRG